MSGLEIAFGIISGVTFLIGAIERFRLGRSVRKNKEIAKKGNKNLEKLCEALGIITEDDQDEKNNEPIREEEMTTPRSEDTNISLRNVKYNRKTGEIILPPEYEIKS